MITMLLVFLLAAPARAQDEEPAIAFVSADRETLRQTAADMARRPSARTIEVEDPYYRARMRYKAVPLKALFAAAYGGSWGVNALGEVFFETLDGYRSHARVSTLLEDGAMIAFADADASHWRMMPGGVAPGPFYLVWMGAEQTPKNGYPWPWQISGVKLTVLEDEYPKALPKGAAPESAAVRGWSIFRRSCISCHSISDAGGTVGPDLNEPRGITRYQDKKFLKAYIRKPSSFRHTKMPDFPELTDANLNDLMSYFDHMTHLAETK